MNNKYKIIYSGNLKAGTDVTQFIENFMRLFKASEATSQKLASLGRATILKDNLDEATAHKYRQVMDNIGMIVKVEPVVDLSHNIVVLANTPSPPQQSDTQESRVRCPKCGSDRVRGDDCNACGIIISGYLAREARKKALEAQQSSAKQTPNHTESINNNSTTPLDANNSNTKNGKQSASKLHVFMVVIGVAIVIETYFSLSKLTDGLSVRWLSFWLAYYLGGKTLGVILAMLPAWILLYHLELIKRLQATCNWYKPLFVAAAIYIIGISNVFSRLVYASNSHHISWLITIFIMIGSIGVMTSLVGVFLSLARSYKQ